MAEKHTGKRKPPASPGSHDDAPPPKEKKSKHHRSHSSHPQRVVLASSDIKKLQRNELIAKWKEQDEYVSYLLKKTKGADEAQKSKESEARAQLQESVKRENILNMKLATKHQEMQDLLTQIHDLKQAQTQSVTNLHSVLLDPAVNLIFQKMKEELKTVKEQLETAQGDLSGWKFTSDSVAGKKLMTKCRLLIKENEELGKQLSQGKIAKLEAEIALQKKYSQELLAVQNGQLVLSLLPCSASPYYYPYCACNSSAGPTHYPFYVCMYIRT
jgi:hypothetical protein